MSNNMYEDLYNDVCKELYDTRERLLNEVHLEKMRVIKLEGHRLMLLSQFECAANLLKREYPSTAALFLANIEKLRNSYETAPPKVAVLPTCEARCVDEPVHGPAESTRRAPVHTEAGSTGTAPF